MALYKIWDNPEDVPMAVLANKINTALADGNSGNAFKILQDAFLHIIPSDTEEIREKAVSDFANELVNAGFDNRFFWEELERRSGISIKITRNDQPEELQDSDLTRELCR